MDAGWIESVDFYYERHVEQILDSVLYALSHDARRTYTHGDIYYFKRWYLSQTHDVKLQIKNLVDKGQLELVHGGLVSTDEACPSYSDML